MSTYPSLILTDSSILVAYYSVKDTYHGSVCRFMEVCNSELVTTIACVTEVMYLHRRYRNSYFERVALL